MTPDFWHLIESTRPETWDPERHAEILTEAMVESGTEATLRFAAAHDEAFDGLYSWDLWGAAYLALGGCSDDAFEYLRAWIIAAGESVWEKARTDPESLFVDILEGADDPDSRWEELRLHEGEPLLYAAGEAHERLTGKWLPNRSRPYPSEPSGDEWDEDDLPRLYPNLYSSLPDDWWGADSRDDNERIRVMIQVERGVAAFSEGHHETAGELLDPIVNDPVEWAVVAEERRVDVAYAVGIGRLLSGDVDGAANALLLVESELPEAEHVRRALAQVELARGDLDNASRWIDIGERGSRLDRVLAAKLAWRRGDHEEAVRRANAEMGTSVAPGEHPWDIAGSAYQLGQILADAGDVDNAQLAVGVMTQLLREAPPDLPLLTHLRLLVAAITRLQGRPDDALALLRELQDGLDGTELAECLREQARAERALGHGERAAALYQASIDEFGAAGERWETMATRDEAEG